MLVLAACAVVVTGLLIDRWLEGRGPTGQVARDTGGPLPDSLWQASRSEGHSIGTPPTGAVDPSQATLVVFSDFECGFCARFALATLPGLVEEHGSSLRVIFRHWPLPNHRLALPAAKAAECAAVQGRFREFHDRLFAARDSVGIVSFVQFAEQAGVADLDRFNSCFASEQSMPQIERDAALALAVGGHGTPTLLLDGVRLAGAQTDSGSVSDLVGRAIRRKR